MELPGPQEPGLQVSSLLMLFFSGCSLSSKCSTAASASPHEAVCAELVRRRSLNHVAERIAQETRTHSDAQLHSSIGMRTRFTAL